MRVKVERAGPDRIVFSVVDTGIGIAPEFHENIFRDFTQVQSPLQRRLQGTGLGLSLGKKLAEVLGGKVGMRSAPGKGSVFTVTIPLQLAPPAHHGG